MPSELLEQAVTQGDTGWDFRCPGVLGSFCGDPGAPFTSTGWPTKATATARGAQHFAEHKGEGVAQTLEDFRADRGLVVNDDGSVTLKDI